MEEASLSSLHNRYFIMRHGKSRANEEGVILSHPEIGTTDYGLVEEGIQQAKSSALEAKSNKVLDNTTVIVSSDFTRARETAEIAREILGADKIIITPLLRERSFGNWEGKPNKHYQDVWNDDRNDAHHKINNVESTAEVLTRTIALIKELEDKYHGRNMLLVSHGDALQILQTAFEKVSSSHHRSLKHLETAEIRELLLR
jgi:broad specificity phosphatase PhoE